MSGSRDWAAAFTPPPPPPLKSVKPEPTPTPEAAPAETSPQPEPPNADPAPTQAPARVASTVTTLRPGVAATPADPDPLNGVPKVQRALASTLLAALGERGLQVDLVGARSTRAGLSLSLGFPDPATGDAVDRAAAELAELLDVEDVRVVHRRGEASARVEVLTQPAAARASRQTAVWVPAALREVVVAAAERQELSPTDFFLQAFNRQWENLEALFPNRALAAGPMPVKTSRRRRNVKTGVQMWLYLGPEQLDLLDTTVESTGAGSRSAFATRLLAHDLGVPEND